MTHRTIGLSVAVSDHHALPARPKVRRVCLEQAARLHDSCAPPDGDLRRVGTSVPLATLVPLSYQTWKLSHRFMGALVALAVTHSLSAHTYVKTAPLLAGVRLRHRGARAGRVALPRIRVQVRRPIPGVRGLDISASGP